MEAGKGKDMFVRNYIFVNIETAQRDIKALVSFVETDIS